MLEQLNTNRDYDDDEVTERLWQIFVDSLLVLDSQGLFGDGEARNTLTISVVWGDWDAVAYVRSARELNPVPSYLRFAQSQLKSLRYGLVEIERSRSPYREEAIARIQNTINMVTSDLESSG